MNNAFRLGTPVAFLVFNRPETTARVFAEIRRARPPTLLVVADGPRSTVSGESGLCEEVRKIATSVDWPCTVLTNFADSNLGCKRRVSSGLTWVFEQVEQAIILEDDCLPDPTFFRFCDELLVRYQQDERVMSIAGSNLLRGHQRTTDSYYFSRWGQIWGWATWRRAWQLYDVEMKIWPAFRDGGWLEDVFHNHQLAKYWTAVLERTYSNKVDTWDYQWELALWASNGLAVIPKMNLVSNLGIGAGATHTKQPQEFAALPTQAITFPLVHPLFTLQDTRTDAALYKRVEFGRPTVLQRVRRALVQPASSYLRWRRRRSVGIKATSGIL